MGRGTTSVKLLCVDHTDVLALSVRETGASKASFFEETHM